MRLDSLPTLIDTPYPRRGFNIDSLRLAGKKQVTSAPALRATAACGRKRYNRIGLDSMERKGDSLTDNCPRVRRACPASASAAS